MSDKPKEITPPGVIAMLIGKDGEVMATATCFELDCPGGFTLLESQRSYVRKRLAMEVVKSYAGEPIYEALEAYDCEQIMGKMIRRGGCKIHFHPVGHPDA